MSWLLGVSWSKWGAMMRDIELDPATLADSCHAMLIRWLASHSAQTPTLHSPMPGKFLVRLRQALGKVPATRFALCLGWDATAGHRWLRMKDPIAPTGRRALALLDDDDPKILAANWVEWAENAEREAALRGIDLAKSKGWTSKVVLLGKEAA